MSLTPVATRPESSQVYDTTEPNQWNQDAEPATNGTPQEWSEPPQQIPIPVSSSSGINPGFYNGPAYNGNGSIAYPPTINVPFERSASSTNGVYIMNGVRPNNILTPGIIRPNGFSPMLNGNNGYINAIANGRYIRAPGWVPTTKVSNGVKKQKRNRTAFTSHQMMELEQEYTRTRYLDRNRRIELSEILNLNQRTIKIWFQNRRMKEKKDRAESLEESEEVSTTESSPELGNDVPMLIHEQYPVTVTSNEIYSRAGLYMDHYPVSSSPAVLPTTLPQMQNQMANDFVEYVPDNSYEPQAQCKQVHLQVHHYNNYSNGVQEVPQETTMQADSCTTSAPSAIPDQSWDLSWIRSIQADEEF